MKKHKLSTVVVSVASWLLSAPALLAQPNVGFDEQEIAQKARTSFTIDNLIALIETIASWVLVIIGLIGVVFLLYGAFMYITSGGSDEKVASAKKIIIYSLIGIAVAILAFAIVSFVASIIT